MQTLKSVLVVALLSFCAFQSNANVLLTVSQSVELGGIIEWTEHNRTINIQANTPELLNVTLINNSGEIVYEDILTGNSERHIINLQHLAPGAYKLIASSMSETVYGIVIIE